MGYLYQVLADPNELNKLKSDDPGTSSDHILVNYGNSRTISIMTTDSATATSSRIESQRSVRVAAIQMAAGPNIVGNLEEAARLIEMAAAQGAKLVALPEYF